MLLIKHCINTVKFHPIVKIAGMCAISIHGNVFLKRGQIKFNFIRVLKRKMIYAMAQLQAKRIVVPLLLKIKEIL